MLETLRKTCTYVSVLLYCRGDVQCFVLLLIFFRNPNKVHGTLKCLSPFKIVNFYLEVMRIFHVFYIHSEFTSTTHIFAVGLSLDVCEKAGGLMGSGGSGSERSDSLPPTDTEGEPGSSISSHTSQV